jgi:uncharacterized protein (DUF1499 family)
MRLLPLVLLLCACGGEAQRPAPSTQTRAAGQLAPVPESPNAVSSQAPPSDRLHHIAPLPIQGEPGAFFEAVVSAAQALPGARLKLREPGYAHLECTSRLMRFVDDLELILDAPAGLVHVRSASRVGHGDLGVNRKRVEALRAALAR